MFAQAAVIPDHLEAALGRGEPQVALFQTDTTGARGSRPDYIRQAYLVAVPTTDTISAVDDVLRVSHLRLLANVQLGPERREVWWFVSDKAFSLFPRYAFLSLA